MQADKGTPLCAKFPFPPHTHTTAQVFATQTQTPHTLQMKMAFLLALLATQSAASTAPLPPGVDVLSGVTTGFNINSSNTNIQLAVSSLTSLMSGDIADTQTTYLQHVVLNLTAPAGVVLVRISARRQRSVVVSTHPLHMLLCFFTLHHVCRQPKEHRFAQSSPFHPTPTPRHRYLQHKHKHRTPFK